MRLMVCPLLLAIGLALLLVSEFTGLAALRIVAVGVLLAGAVGGGRACRSCGRAPGIVYIGRRTFHAEAGAGARGA